MSTRKRGLTKGRLNRRGKPDGRARSGFASHDPERREALARMGGQAAHKQGKAHEFKPGEIAAVIAGRKGGRAKAKKYKERREGA